MRFRETLRRKGSRAGLSALEVTIAMTIVSTILLASAKAFSTNFTAVNTAQSMTRGAVFLETVMEDLSVQPYENLAAFNGNRIYDGATAQRSSYAVDLTVFLAAVDLQQVQAVLTDLRTNREIARLTTLRSRR